MAVSVTSVMAEVRRLLQDAGTLATRYSDSSLLSILNLGQFAIAKLDPTATSTLYAHTLTAGNRQIIPADGIMYMRALSVLVAGNPSASIVATTLDNLDTSNPMWRTMSSSRVHQAAPDPLDPLAFYVYPSAAGAIQVQYSRIPTDVVVGTLNITLPDRYRLALQHFMVYKALEQDSDNANNAALSVKHYQHFMGALFGPKAVTRQPKGEE